MSEDRSLSLLKYADLSAWSLGDFRIFPRATDYPLTKQRIASRKKDVLLGYILPRSSYSHNNDIVVVQNTSGSRVGSDVVMVVARDFARQSLVSLPAWPEGRGTQWHYGNLKVIGFTERQIEGRAKPVEPPPSEREKKYHFDLKPLFLRVFGSANPKSENAEVVGNERKVEASKEIEGATEFLPSTTLVGFWIRGVEAHRIAARRPVQEDQQELFLQKQTAADFQKAFALRFKRMLSVVANRHRYGISDYKILGSRGRFELPIQYQILDRVQIRPDESTEFFALFFKELSAFLRKGGKIAGGWGKLALQQDGSIELMVNPRKSLEANERELAEIIE